MSSAKHREILEENLMQFARNLPLGRRLISSRTKSLRKMPRLQKNGFKRTTLRCRVGEGVTTLLRADDQQGTKQLLEHTAVY